MEKNTIIAIVLSTIVVIVGLTLQSILFPQTQTQTQSQTQPAQEAVNTAAPAATQVTSEAVASPIVATADAETAIREETSVLETPLVQVTFTNKGGDILSYRLKKHSDAEGFVEMADFVTPGNRAFSLALGGVNGAPVDQLFTVKRIGEYAIGFYRPITLKNADGSESTFTLVKQYTFHPEDYMFELEVTVDGAAGFNGLSIGTSAYSLKTSPQIGPDWNVKQDRYDYRKFFYLLNGKKKHVSLGAGATKSITDAYSWAGVAGKYFTLIALPSAKPVETLFTTVADSSDSTKAQMVISRGPITSSRNTDVWRFYLGPRNDSSLAKYNVAVNNPYGITDGKLNEIVESSGILAPVEILLKVIMEFFYKLIPNWGVAIILMTILMRIIIFPLTKKSSESTLKMQELQPQIKEIQDKYKGNQQKMNEEMAKFYQTAGYNPLSGCLPLLIQFPLIFAMYGLFNNYFEFRGAMFIPGWIPDLSQGDSILAFPFTVPLVGWSNLRLLPILYVISQLFFGKVTQTPGMNQQNSQMKIMMYGMPLIFFFLFYDAPAGLLLYWTFSNILTLLQQIIINKMMHAKKTGAASDTKPNFKIVKK